MIYQGEQVRFWGTIASAECGHFKDITDLAGFKIHCRVYNPENDYEVLFTSEGEDKNIMVEDDTYCYDLSGADTSRMLGECYVEVAIEVGGEIILSDDKGRFTVYASPLGQTI